MHTSTPGADNFRTDQPVRADSLAKTAEVQLEIGTFVALVTL
jgi:hypothetical protein